MFSEAEISSFMRCDLADFRVDPFWDTILITSKSLIREASDMRISNLSTIRDRYSRAWERMKSQDIPTDVYIRGHKLIPGIAFRTVSLLRDYQIVVPHAIYDLSLGFEGSLGFGGLEVDYAVARPWRKNVPWLCLSLIRSKAPLYYQYPDPVSLARWLHLQSVERYKDIQLLTVPILNGNSWKVSGLSKPLVRRQLESIMESMTRDGHGFARSGPHCENCVSHKCLETIYEWRSDGHKETNL